MPSVSITPQEFLQRSASGERNFSAIRLTEANLSGANLSGFDLSQASLSLANLSGANLGGADLRGAKLNVARLSSANLSDVNLTGADLNVANLIRADLRRANLRQASLIRGELMRADLSDADLTEANLSEAMLREAKLRQANLSGANLCRADLGEACLMAANLSKANLARANLSRADLRGADLRGAELRHADFRGGNFSDADLSGANLRWVDFTGARLSGANLRGAKLSGANLSGVDLSQANLTQATLVHADLTRANLIEVEWRGADLTGAKLTGAKLYGVSRFDLEAEGIICDWVDLSPYGDQSQICRFTAEEAQRFFNETPPTIRLTIDFDLDPDSHFAIAAAYRQIAQQCSIFQRSPQIHRHDHQTELIFTVEHDRQLLPVAYAALLPFRDGSVAQQHIRMFLDRFEAQVRAEDTLPEHVLIQAHQFDMLTRRDLEAVQAVKFSKQMHQLLDESALFQAPTQITVTNSSNRTLKLHQHPDFGQSIRRRSHLPTLIVPSIEATALLSLPDLTEMLQFIENC